MVADELTRALIERAPHLEDISESHRPVVDIIGMREVRELGEYAKRR